MNRKVLPFVVALCLAQAVPSGADGPSVLSGYRIASWTGGDGITLGTVRQIVQDQDGYLWLASDAGLVRFDGLRFATSDLAEGAMLPAVPSHSVHLGRDGSLWAGYNAGRGIYRIVRGTVEGPYLRDKISGRVNTITEDHNGTLWAGHDNGLHRFVDGEWQGVFLPSAESDPRVFDLHEDREGTLWVATATGLYRRGVASPFERVSGIEGIIRAMSEDASGVMWITDRSHGFRRVDAEPNDEITGSALSLLHDTRGDLWVATLAHGIWKVRSAAREATPIVHQATTEGGLLAYPLSGLLEDRDGNIWVGSIQGIRRLQPPKAMSLPDVGVVQGIAVDRDGTAWLGTTDGLIALAGLTVGSPGVRRTVSRLPVRTIHHAGDGTLWVATDDGLYRLVSERLVRESFEGVPLTRIGSIASDRQGVLWLCDELQGLVRLAKGRAEPVQDAANGTTARPKLVHVDGVGRLWIAFDNGTVRAVHANGRIEQYGAAEGLPHLTVFAIYDDRAGNVWVGGDAGLSRLFGVHFKTWVRGYTLPGGAITQIVEDDIGDLWMGLGSVGLVHVNSEDISHAIQDPSHRVRYSVYNPSDGTAGISVRVSNGTARAPNGLLWFVTSGGVTVLDPRTPRDEQGAGLARLRIEGVAADNLRSRAVPHAILPPRLSRLDVNYTTLNLSSFDDLLIRYRLDGFDTHWVDGTGRRQASYTNLPPGRYTFRLQAARTANTWDGGANVDWSFSIAPTFYQTPWFYCVCAIGLTLTIAGGWRLRMWHVRKQLAAVLNERVRLSREIHETLLQSLVGVALQLDAASGEVGDASSRVRVNLVRMRKQIEEHIREARRSIWNLRAPALDSRDMITALRETGDRLTAGRVRFALNVTGTPRPCGPKLETQVLRIAQEAVTNAVHHAGARHVEIDLGFTERVLRLRVVDDGGGFDPQNVPASSVHYGLVGMKERAADVGGRCTIEAAPGTGVQVIAEFPLAS